LKLSFEHVCESRTHDLIRKGLFEKKNSTYLQKLDRCDVRRDETNKTPKNTALKTQSTNKAALLVKNLKFMIKHQSFEMQLQRFFLKLSSFSKKHGLNTRIVKA